MTLIQGAEGIFTGLPGEAMRAHGAIRIACGRIVAIGARPVAWMAEHDWLGPDVWFAHLVHVDDAEIGLLIETGTGVAHCPQSKCRLGSGIAPAEEMATRGGAVSLAVDGAASNESADMISEMHTAWHVHRAPAARFVGPAGCRRRRRACATSSGRRSGGGRER
jgi:Amidohydrolase family